MSSDKQIKTGGRAPLSQKGGAVKEMANKFGSDEFAVPESVQAEMKAKGLVGRWIDVAQLKTRGGYHRHGWTPIQFDCLKGQKSNPFADSSMEGFLIKNGMILAVQTEEYVQGRREMNKRRAAIQAGRQASEEFKAHIKSVKGAKVVEESDDEE